MKRVLFKIALRNVRRQIGNYLIYFITVSLTVALLFSVNNLILSEMMDRMTELYADFVQPILILVVAIMAAVIAFVLGYATTFLLRRRKREFGVYLTLGMTRRDVIAIFAGETGVTFLLSLGMGILLGLGAYQAFTAIFLNFLEQPYEFAAYSFTGSLLTVVMVALMFLIASLAALFYLRFARISRLLQGESTAPKTVRFPVIWIAVFVLSLVGLVVSVMLFMEWMQSSDFYDRIGEMGSYLVIFFLSAGFLPVGLSRTVMWILLRFPALSARGTGRFTVRQLSARINASSLMMGVLSVLLAVAVIGPNIFFTFDLTIDRSIEDAGFRYDISSFQEGQVSFEDALVKIEEYADIEDSCLYRVYCSPAADETQEGYYGVAESDARHALAIYGYTMPALNGGYAVCRTDDLHEEPEFFAGGWEEITIGGGTYACAGTLAVPSGVLYKDLYMSSDYDFYIVPDEAAAALQAQADAGGNSYGEGVRYTRALVVDLADGWYDAAGLYLELRNDYGNGTYGSSFDIRAYERYDRIGQVALFLLGDLFVSAVFLLMTMAMLSLKTLSVIAEDRERYRMLWRLGASEGMLGRSLFAQMFFYCFLPFVVPLGMCFPLVGILQTFAANFGYVTVAAGAIAAQVAGFAGVMLALYAVYFLAAYLVARLDIRRTLRAVG